MENTSTIEKCPCCNAKLSSSIFAPNQLVSKNFGPFIRDFTEKQFDDYCEKCYPGLKSEALSKYKSEKALLNDTIKALLDGILIVSINAPANWDYEVLGLVTAQTTTGTGILSELSSSFTDFFGAQSGAYNQKISNGEEACKAQLRTKCLALGGNTIIGADIDYAEVGGDKGMLMVCMTGTAINLINHEVLGEARSKNIEELKTCLNTHKNISGYVISSY